MWPREGKVPTEKLAYLQQAGAETNRALNHQSRRPNTTNPLPIMKLCSKPPHASSHSLHVPQYCPRPCSLPTRYIYRYMYMYINFRQRVPVFVQTAKTKTITLFEKCNEMHPNPRLITFRSDKPRSRRN